MPKLNVATWNVAMMRTPFSKTKHESIAHAVAGYDIVAVQENFWHVSQFDGSWNVDAPALDRNTSYRISRAYPVSSGLLTLSTPDIAPVSSDSLLLQRGVYSDWLCPKSVMHSRLHVCHRGTPPFFINVFNLHLQADYGMGSECCVIAAQLHQVATFVRRTLARVGGSALVMGDFNTDTLNPFYSDMLYAHMADSVPTPDFELHAITNLAPTHSNGNVVDHIFFLRDKRCNRIVPPTSLTVHKRANASTHSDHYLVSAQLTLLP